MKRLAGSLLLLSLAAGCAPAPSEDGNELTPLTAANKGDGKQMPMRYLGSVGFTRLKQHVLSNLGWLTHDVVYVLDLTNDGGSSHDIGARLTQVSDGLPPDTSLDEPPPLPAPPAPPVMLLYASSVQTPLPVIDQTCRTHDCDEAAATRPDDGGFLMQRNDGTAWITDIVPTDLSTRMLFTFIDKVDRRVTLDQWCLAGCTN